MSDWILVVLAAPTPFSRKGAKAAKDFNVSVFACFAPLREIKKVSL